MTISTLGFFIQQLIDSKTDVEIPGDVRRIVSQWSSIEKRRSSNVNNNNNVSSRSIPGRVTLIEDNNNLRYDMKKSNSAGKESRLIKTNSMMEPPYPLKSALSQPNLGSKLEKVSSFFANSHNHMKQQRVQVTSSSSAATGGGGSCVDAVVVRGNDESTSSIVDSSNSLNGNDENDPKTVNIDIKITDNNADSNVNSLNDNLKIDTIAALEKSISLPRNARMPLKSSKSAYELGKLFFFLILLFDDCRNKKKSFQHDFPLILNRKRNENSNDKTRGHKFGFAEQFVRYDASVGHV